MDGTALLGLPTGVGYYDCSVVGKIRVNIHLDDAGNGK